MSETTMEESYSEEVESFAVEEVSSFEAVEETSSTFEQVEEEEVESSSSSDSSMTCTTGIVYTDTATIYTSSEETDDGTVTVMV